MTARATSPSTASPLLTRYGFLLLLLAPVSIVALALYLFERSGTLSFDEFMRLVRSVLGSTDSSSLPQTLTELRARYIWLTSVVLNVTVPIGAVMLCSVMLWRAHQGAQRWVVLGIGAFLCLGGVLVLVETIGQKGVLYRTVFGFTYFGLEHSHQFAPHFLAFVQTLVSGINLLAIFVPIVAVLAASSSLAPPHDGRQADLAHLVQQMRNLKEVLYAGSAILVTGILHMGSWLRWPVSLVGDASVQSAVLGMVLSITLYWGTVFTLVLIATYGPAAAVISARAREQLESDPSAQGIAHPEQWLKERGFFVGISDELPQIAVMFAPLMAGPLGALVATSIQASK